MWWLTCGEIYVYKTAFGHSSLHFLTLICKYLIAEINYFSHFPTNLFNSEQFILWSIKNAIRYFKTLYILVGPIYIFVSVSTQVKNKKHNKILWNLRMESFKKYC
jgi:hypothetical protein